MVGRTISHYRVLRHVGGGGMGVVYEAEDLVLRRHVALKFLAGARSTDVQSLQRFEREARTASALNHPHICTIHEFVEHDGERFIVMELLEGQSLRDRLRGGAMDAAAVVSMAAQIADALGAAHRAGVVHRDLTPSNIFITGRGDAKVLDFGLAKLQQVDRTTWNADAPTATADDTLTSPGAMMGTVAYMSPEQVRGLELDQRTDLFSLGVVLYEAAAGVRPFAGKTSALIFDAILHADPVPMRRVNHHVSPELERIVAKALEKDPALRYQAAAEIRADLQRLQRDAHTPAPGIRVARGTSRLVTRAAAVVVVIGGIGAAAYWRGAPEPKEVWTSQQQITSGPGTESDPAISPDGSTVAYTSDESGTDDIWIVDVRGGPPQRVTTSEASERRPVWMPDGSALLYVSDRGGRPGIWRAPRLDADAATLLVADADDPALSPDGTRVAFVRSSAGGFTRIGVAALASPANVQVLTGQDDGQWGHSRPAWSPDGRSICYDAWDGLRVVPGDGGPSRRLTAADARSDLEPTWSADGQFIYFTSVRDGRPALWRVAAAGGSPERVTSGSGTERTPAISRDGRLLAYSTSSSTRDLRLINLETGAQRVFGSSLDELFPTFSPDGRTIYFISNRWGTFDLWQQVISDDGPVGMPARLAEQEGVESHPECSPDGRWIAYYRIRDGLRNLWIVPSDGGGAHQVTDEHSDAIHPSWSDDGRWIAFASSREGTQQIWIQQVRDGRPEGAPTRLTSDRGLHQWPAWSPDGSRIAYIAHSSGLEEVAIVDVREPTTPAIITKGARALRVRWHRPRGLLLVSGRWNGKQFELRAMNTGGGPAVLPHLPVMLGTDPSPTFFDVSRDGRLVIASHQEPAGDIWAMQSKLR